MRASRGIGIGSSGYGILGKDIGDFLESMLKERKIPHNLSYNNVYCVNNRPTATDVDDSCKPNHILRTNITQIKVENEDDFKAMFVNIVNQIKLGQFIILDLTAHTVILTRDYTGQLHLLDAQSSARYNSYDGIDLIIPYLLHYARFKLGENCVGNEFSYYTI